MGGRFFVLAAILSGSAALLAACNTTGKASARM